MRALTCPPSSSGRRVSVRVSVVGPTVAALVRCGPGGRLNRRRASARHGPTVERTAAAAAAAVGRVAARRQENGVFSTAGAANGAGAATTIEVSARVRSKRSAVARDDDDDDNGWCSRCDEWRRRQTRRARHNGSNTAGRTAHTNTQSTHNGNTTHNTRRRYQHGTFPHARLAGWSSAAAADNDGGRRCCYRRAGMRYATAPLPSRPGRLPDRAWCRNAAVVARPTQVHNRASVSERRATTSQSHPSSPSSRTTISRPQVHLAPAVQAYLPGTGARVCFAQHPGRRK